MNLVFKYTDDSTLGSIQHTDVMETLVPAYKEDSHDIFLKHLFSAKPDIDNWQIKKMDVEGQDVTIFLSEAESPSSVVHFAKSQYKPLNFYLVPYGIVEVDFGYHSDLFDIKGGRVRNTKNVASLLPGEMHKRRPCIILGVKDTSVQVIPLSTSTQAQNGNSSGSICLDSQSFENMAPRYTEKESFALLGMVQTVSAHRVFSPRNTNLKYEHKYHRYKLCATDREKIKTALAEQYNQNIITQMSNLSRQKINLEKEKTAILRANERIRGECSIVAQRNKELEAFILKVGKDMDLGESVDAIVDKYHKSMGV